MKTKSCLEIKKGERTFQFILDSDSPIGEALDASIEFWNHISKINQNALSENTVQKDQPSE